MIKGENNKDGKGATFTFVLPQSKEESVKVSNIHLLLYTAFKWITPKQDNSRIYVRWCI
jgi:hypothetical protein